jgi:hypothetical protein
VPNGRHDKNEAGQVWRAPSLPQELRSFSVVINDPVQSRAMDERNDDQHQAAQPEDAKGNFV